MLTLRSAAPSCVTSTPSISTWPPLGASSPAIRRSVVVLPQPLGPRIVVSVPLGTTRSTPFTASAPGP
jgi:hypothetical protein